MQETNVNACFECQDELIKLMKTEVDISLTVGGGGGRLIP
jgi:hypothetical protein